MITTDNFRVTNKDFFKILLANFFRRNWWVLLILVVIILLIAFHKERDSSELFIMDFLIGILIGKTLQIRSFAYSNSNMILLLKRHFEIFDDKIVEIIEDGTNFTIKIEHFIKTFQTKKFYILFYTQEQFIFISKDSFRSKQDMEWFEKEILLKNKTKHDRTTAPIHNA